MTDTWVTVGAVGAVERGDVMRFDHDGHTFAVYRTDDDRYFATDGLCTHGRVHLAEGFVDGTTIECSKHNGRFDLTTGTAKGAPALVDLGCHPVRIVEGRIELRVA